MLDKEELNKLMNQARIEIVTDPKGFHKFLKSSAVYTYNYSFRNQLAIYAQMPDSKEVASEDAWKKVGRYLKPDARPITLLDENDMNQGKIVYSLNDTEGERPPIWRTRWCDQDQVLKNLNEKNNAQDASIPEALHTSVERFSDQLESEFEDTVHPYCKEENISEDRYQNFKSECKKLLRNAMAYIQFARSGFHVPEEYRYLDGTKFYSKYFHQVFLHLADLDIRAGIFENQTRLSILNEAKKRGEMPDQNKEFLEYVGQMEAIQNQSKEITTQYVIEDLTFLSEPFRAATWYEDEEEETIAQ